MATFNIICGGPGPHVPASGVLGTSDRAPTADMRCSAPACVKPVDAETVNQQTIRDQAQAAFAANRTYVALPAPTAAQTTAQVKALSRQMNGVLRLLLNQFDGTD